MCLLREKSVVKNSHFTKYFPDLTFAFDCTNEDNFNPTQDRPFRGCSRKGGQKGSLPKICHTYCTIMKLGTVVPYLKKIKKNIQIT